MLTKIFYRGLRIVVEVTNNDELVYMANYDRISEARKAAFGVFNHGHVVDMTVV